MCSLCWKKPLYLLCMCFNALIRVCLYICSRFVFCIFQQDRISRLNKENEALKHNLDATSATLKGFRNESSKAASSTSTVLKVLSIFWSFMKMGCQSEASLRLWCWTQTWIIVSIRRIKNGQFRVGDPICLRGNIF